MMECPRCHSTDPQRQDACRRDDCGATAAQQGAQVPSAQRMKETLEFIAAHFSSDWPERCQSHVLAARHCLSASPQAPAPERCEWCCGTGRFADHACRFCAGKARGSVFDASPQAPVRRELCHRNPAPNASQPMVPTSPTIKVAIGYAAPAGPLCEVLANVRNALQRANDMDCGPICDTIWMPDGMTTLFDYIDSHLKP